METELKDLIGRKVNKVFINSNFLKFETDLGDLLYKVNGECCSSSYFYDFYGIKPLLKNGKVLEVKTVGLLPSDVVYKNANYDDRIKVYGYQITTECENYGERTSVFSFRNSSNGWYGGDIELVSNETETRDMRELTDDIVEVK